LLSRSVSALFTPLCVTSPDSFPRHIAFLRHLDIPRHLDFLVKTPFSSLGPTDKFVVCNVEDAKELLRRGPPQLPMLVAGDTRMKRLTFERFFSILITLEHLDVHDFGRDFDNSEPQRLPVGDAIALFEKRRGDQPDAANFLNLALVKPNAAPTFIEDLDDFNIIPLTRGDNGKGTNDERFIDLDACAGFQLCATKGAVHLPHVDRHGVMTMVYNDVGEKLWSM
ncbi:hypothetical protein EDB81DRAFT_119209, partial [Dactylonectria macrodidyma]